MNEDVGIEEGLTKEEAFFRNKEPWRSVEDKGKFGTKSLRVTLAGLQMVGESKRGLLFDGSNPLLGIAATIKE